MTICVYGKNINFIQLSFMFAQNKKLIKTFTIFDANFISE